MYESAESSLLLRRLMRVVIVLLLRRGFLLLLGRFLLLLRSLRLGLSFRLRRIRLGFGLPVGLFLLDDLGRHSGVAEAMRQGETHFMADADEIALVLLGQLVSTGAALFGRFRCFCRRRVWAGMDGGDRLGDDVGFSGNGGFQVAVFGD